MARTTRIYSYKIQQDLVYYNKVNPIIRVIYV